LLLPWAFFPLIGKGCVAKYLVVMTMENKIHGSKHEFSIRRGDYINPRFGCQTVNQDYLWAFDCMGNIEKREQQTFMSQQGLQANLASFVF
jgi:hypothetical protein